MKVERLRQHMRLYVLPKAEKFRQAASHSPTTSNSFHQNHHPYKHRSRTTINFSAMAQFTGLPYELRAAIWQYHFQETRTARIQSVIVGFRTNRQMKHEMMEAGITIIRTRGLYGSYGDWVRRTVPIWGWSFLADERLQEWESELKAEAKDSSSA